MKLTMIRAGLNFLPCYETDKRIYSAVADGGQVMVEVKKSRNLMHHRKFFALLQSLLDNSDRWQTVEEVLTVVLFSIGYAEKVMTLSGKEILTRKSIAFENMDQLEFNELYKKSVDVISEYLGITPDELERNVE
jgi:predicted site-specific integrase-resolvase